MLNKRAVFLDRDGTLIKIIHRPDFKKEFAAPFKFEELEFMPYATHLMEHLQEWKFLRILITNQPDVAHGYMIQDEWEKIQNAVVEKLQPDDVFMCRHRTQDNCPLKKPSPMMILAAADKWGIDLPSSYMVGDTEQDMQAGSAAGCRTILMKSSYNSGVKADFTTSKGLVGVLRIIMRTRS